jgi:hypothetical protein
MTDLIAIYGETDGTSATGTFNLKSEWFESAVSYIKVDKGLSAKIWIFEVSGKAVDVIISMSPDDGTTWIEVKRIKLASDGHLELDHRKPVIITAKNNTTRFRLTWSQAVAGLSYINGVIEFDQAR